MQPAIVYANELSRFGYGRPMWMPDRPGVPVEIGDVGFVETATGSFRRLFNVTRPPWDPLNSIGVPENFKRLDISLVQKAEELAFLKAGPICSHTISKELVLPEGSEDTDAGTTTHTFGCSRDQGAILFLGADADRQRCSSNSILPRYMAANYSRWCKFAKSKGFKLGELEGPLLVRGYIKAPAWGVAAWMTGGASHNLTVSNFSGAVSGEGLSFCTTDSPNDPLYRSGPRLQNSLCTMMTATPPSTPGSASFPQVPSDQCVFLSYYKAKGRQHSDSTPRSKLVALTSTTEGDQARLPDNSGFRVDPKYLPRDAEYYDPLDEALEYILEKSPADIAVVSHEDLSDIYQYGWPKNLLGYLRMGRPSVDIARLPDWQCVGTIIPRSQVPSKASVGERTLTRQPSFIVPDRPKGVRPPRRRPERQSTALEFFQIPTPPSSPGPPGTFGSEESPRDSLVSARILPPSISRRSSLSTLTSIIERTNPPSRTPSPSIPSILQFGNGRAESPSMVGIALDVKAESSPPNPTLAYEAHLVTVAVGESVTVPRPHSYQPYQPRRRPSGSLSPVKGPRPRFRPLSTIVHVSNIVASGEFAFAQ